MSSRFRAATAQVVALACLIILAPSARAQTPAAPADTPTRELGVVTVTGGRPTSLPTQIPTTMEGVSRQQLEETINATDSEDALKYLPSLLVRKRYIGDYNHAILSTRASGTGNSARSMVYADGILLSNLLGNGVGGLSFPPRWGLVTPEEIERVDVMYGPFSAAYPGNSVGAVVDYVTRLPTRLESHASIGFVTQPFELYGTRDTFRAWQASASIGSRAGAWSWWFNANRTDSEGQPLTFATRLARNGVASAAGTPVSGAVAERDNANQPWYVLGTATQFHTVQDHAKLKLAYDFTPTVRASYTLGVWQNTATGTPASYLRNGAGQPVTGGPINIDGLAFTGSQALGGGDLPMTRQASTHYIHGLSVKSNTRGTWDWEVAASLYDYQSDRLRQNGGANPLPGAAVGGAGTLADGSGTGWHTLALRGTWRPQGVRGEHIVDFGLQRDAWRLRYRTLSLPGNWLTDDAGPLASDVRGDTALTSLWAQDAWAFAPRWKAVLGLRAEAWRARDGLTAFSASSAQSWPQRTENHLSPKAAISYQWSPELVLKASLGRAVRYPTVAELYGATSTTNSQFINDPDLKPERSWTTEVTAERRLGDEALLRLTWFAEDVRDSLYSQTLFDPAANRNVSRVQNIGRIATQGLEAAYTASNVAIKGLDLNASVTYADSEIKENAGFVNAPGDTIGRQQPNIPRWRATMLTSYRFSDRWIGSLGIRYSGTQYRTLNNADVNGFTYMGVSRYLTADLRLVWRIDRRFTASFGIDNVNDYQYWNFHPYPQRAYYVNLRADL